MKIAMVGLATLLIGGCSQYENKPSFSEFYKLEKGVIMMYADKNNDGVITDKEVVGLMGDIAKQNDLKFRPYIGFFDMEGNSLPLEKSIEMFKNYKPSNK